MQKETQNTELTILNYIEQNSDATQRELSEYSGVSLGTINLLLKRMVKKGLVKMERLQPNSIKYFLTPRGIANKIERTYGYVVRTYNEISRLKRRIVEVTDAISSKNEVESILFFGKRDELFEMVEELKYSGSFQMHVELFDDTEKLVKEIFEIESYSVVVWGGETEMVLNNMEIQAVNVMGLLVI